MRELEHPFQSQSGQNTESQQLGITFSKTEIGQENSISGKKAKKDSTQLSPGMRALLVELQNGERNPGPIEIRGRKIWSNW